jgi:hypothetical protein
LYAECLDDFFTLFVSPAFGPTHESIARRWDDTVEIEIASMDIVSKSYIGGYRSGL